MAVPSVPGAINVPAPLTGNEIVAIATGGPQSAQTTTSAIAALATTFDNDFPTNITTAVGTTIPAAAFLTGLINRSGPTAAYTDTTDTAAAIAAAIAASTYPVSFYIDIKNTTAFPQTLQGGGGVVMSASNIVPANSVGEYIVVVSSASVVTFNHVLTSPITTVNPEAAVALATVGAGVITGQGIATQVTTRSGSQSGTPFTDTTDTAAAIILAQPNARIGQSWEYIYQNNTNAPATIQGGSGVTVSGITVVPPNMAARYLVTYTAAGTITMVGLSLGLTAAVSGTVTANAATPVAVSNTAVTATSQILLTYKSGTQGATGAFVSSKTAGSGFSIKSVASDTAVYDYLIIG